MTRRHVAITAALVATLALAIAGGFWWVLGTQSGARWAFEKIGATLPGRLVVEDLRGSIRGPIHVRHLHYESETYDLTAADLRLDWQLRRLARGRLDIHVLRADSVTVRFKPAAEARREEQVRPWPDFDLPLDVLVRDGIVTHLAFYRPGVPEPFPVDSLRIVATLSDSLEIERLALRSPTLNVDARGSMGMDGAYPMTLDARWTYRSLEGLWSGAGTLTGTLDTLHVQQQLASPFTARGGGRLITPFRDLRLDGVVEFSGLRLRDLDPTLPAGMWTGTARVAGAVDSFASSGRVASREAPWGPADATFRIRREPARWIIDQLEMAVPGRRTRLWATGVADTGRRGRLSFDVRWKDLAWPTTGEPLWASHEGRARLRGTLARYEIAGDAAVHIPPRMEGRWHIEGIGDARAIDLAQFEGDLARGRIEGRGRLAWSPAVTWSLHTSGTVATGAIDPRYPGELGFDATSEGRMTPGGPVGTLVVARMAGTVRGSPVSASGDVRMAGDRYQLTQGQATWGGARFGAQGWMGSAWDLGWSFDVPNLATLVPEALGSLKGEGRVTGPRGAMRVRADVQGDSLAWRDVRMRALALKADVDPAGNTQLDLHALRLRNQRFALDSVAVSARGPGTRQQWTASAHGERDRLDAALSLSGSPSAGWRGTLDRLDLVSATAGSWTLASPADILSTTKRVRVRDLCWVSGEARLCANFEGGPSQPMDLDARLTRIPLALLGPLLPPKIALVGPLDGEVDLSTSASGALTANMSLTPGPGEIRYVAQGADTAQVRFDRGSLRVQSSSRGLTGDLAMDFPQTGTLRTRVELPGLDVRQPLGTQELGGRIDAEFRDLRIAQAFLEGVQATQGTLQAHMDLEGTLAEPLGVGTLRVAQGRALVPAAGLDLRDIDFSASRSAGGGIAFEGSVRSGPGTVRTVGHASLAGNRRTLHATIEGQNVQAMDTDVADVRVSPKLTVDVSGRRVDVTGQMDVPRARIESVTSKRQVVRVADDVVVLQDGRPENEPGYDVSARVRVTLGRDVQLQAQGIDVKPTGSIVIVESPGQPTRATGELRAEGGTYRAYGQDLTIEHGRLIFGGGPIDNPALDVRAMRRAADGVVAGVQMRGTLRRPTTSVVSDPGVGETDAVSYLMFGRPLDDVSTGEGAMATRLAAALEAPELLGQLSSGLGLDEAQLRTGGTANDAALVFGKALSPKVYVQYGLGLLDAAATLRLQYALSRMWSLAAEVARENRADVQYNVEW